LVSSRLIYYSRPNKSVFVFTDHNVYNVVFNAGNKCAVTSITNACGGTLSHIILRTLSTKSYTNRSRYGYYGRLWIHYCDLQCSLTATIMVSRRDSSIVGIDSMYIYFVLRTVLRADRRSIKHHTHAPSYV